MENELLKTEYSKAFDDNEKQCCGNCKYAAYSRENGYVCENMDSYYLADYVEHDHGCEEWRNRDD